MLSDRLKKSEPTHSLLYSKHGKPIPQELAEAIESLRDKLFRQYGVNYTFTVCGDGYVLAAAQPGITIHAVVNEKI